MLKRFFFFLMVIYLAACTVDKKQSKYLRWVGDIEKDPIIDNPDFELCYGEAGVRQYFNFSQGLQYEGEMLEIIETFKRQYNAVQVNESGYIRIRFIVNCNGISGRFRLISSDQNYQEFDFDERITDQLLEITKSLDGWKQLPSEEEALDYYQYLIFKIDKGVLIEVLP